MKRAPGTILALTSNVPELPALPLMEKVVEIAGGGRAWSVETKAEGWTTAEGFVWEDAA